jgi:hypothetical protein
MGEVVSTRSERPASQRRQHHPQGVYDVRLAGVIRADEYGQWMRELDRLT